MAKSNAVTIFDLSERYNNLLEVALDSDLPEQDLAAVWVAIDGVDDEISDKCANGIGLIHTLEDRVEAYKKQEARFASERKTLENKIKRIKQLYMDGLRAMGKDKVPTKYGIMAIRKNGGKQSMRYEQDKLPRKFIITELVEKVDVDGLRESLQAGEEIEGAKLLERGYHLSV